MKSIIVTGAAGNMGQAVVQRFVQDGHKIYAALGLGENSRLFSESPHAANIDVQFLNLTDETVSEGYVKGIVARDTAVDTAVCIVGGWQPGTLSETTGYELDKMIKLNFNTAFNVAKPLMEFFERQGRGQFIFIGARPAINPAEGKNQVAYALGKSLLFRLAEIINDQGKFKNIRASVVIPSLLDTPQNRAAMPDAPANEWVTPEVAAETISFLLGDTGENLRETVIKLYNLA
ncbi:MAG: SDR family NAD(P)-dependent oxidoreductase [Lewinellaceae bacterium]|nr:SDR family NAD(P)-dependent oxidoreductase [Lewinellaceae bacterium]